MSKFVTAIAVDVAEVLKLLPAGAFVEAVRWNRDLRQVEVVWDHTPAHTGLDFPSPWPVQFLRDGQTPKNVGQRPQRKPAAETAKPQSKDGRQGRDGRKAARR